VAAKTTRPTATGQCELTVELPDKAPAARAWVTYFRDGGRVRHVVRADDEGSLPLGDLEAGPWRIEVEYGEVFDAIPKPNERSNSLWFPRYLGSETFQVRAGEANRFVLRLRERDHSFIRLLCTDEQGRPLADLASDRERRNDMSMEPIRPMGSNERGEMLVMVPGPPGTRVPLFIFSLTDLGRFARGEFVTTGREQRERVHVMLPTPVKRVVIVRDAGGRAIAALSVSGPSFRLREDVLLGTLAPAVVRSAEILSRQLGFRH